MELGVMLREMMKRKIVHRKKKRKTPHEMDE
jgi:hypothetical protein